MELPAPPRPRKERAARHLGARLSFYKRAGTIILASSIVLWFLQASAWTDGAFGMVEDNNSSLLAAIGSAIAFIFLRRLGFGDWQFGGGGVHRPDCQGKRGVSPFGVLFQRCRSGRRRCQLVGAGGPALSTQLTAYSFMISLCAPCFCGHGAIKREMNNAKWTLAAIGYVCAASSNAISPLVYQFGGLVTGEVAFCLALWRPSPSLAVLIYFLRPNKHNADYKRLWSFLRETEGAKCAPERGMLMT